MDWQIWSIATLLIIVCLIWRLTLTEFVLILLFAVAANECTKAQAEVRELSLDVRKISEMRHAYYPGKEDFKNYVGLNWDVGTEIPSTPIDLYWDNRTYFYGDSAQVRHVGWEFEAGVGSKYAKLFYYHHSEHRMDSDRFDKYATGAKFPIENSVGVRLCFIGCNK